MRRAVIVAVVAGALASAFGALLANAESPGSRASPANTGRPAGDAFFEDFTGGYDPVTHVLARWDVDSEWMAASYRLGNVAYSSDGLHLTTRISPSDIADYTSGEFQRSGFYGYGRYEVIMKASNAPGVISSFFVYAGEDMGDPHDEIDFELLGRTPRQVHLNFFSKGATSAADIDLPFDASADEHLYAFEWSPSAIIWYVDGVEVRRVVGGPGVRIPTTTGRVMANVWAANRTVAEWAGTPTVETTTATYRCMSHVPIGKAGRQCSDAFAPPV